MADYQKLEYIVSTGGQYINTGLLAGDFSSQIIKSEIRFISAIDTTTKIYETYIGCQQNLQYLLRADTGKLTAYGGGSLTYFTTLGDYLDCEMSFTANYNSGTTSLTVNGTTYSGTCSSFGTNTTGIYILGSHNGGDPWYEETGCVQLFYCKFYNNNTLIRDFEPVRRLSDGKIGMLDLVNDVFYPSNGTSEFVEGPEVDGFTYNGIIPSAITYNGTELQKLEYNGEVVWDKRVDDFLSGNFNGAYENPLVTTTGTLRSPFNNTEGEETIGLTSVSLPNCETVITYGFANCTTLTTVSLPSVTSIGTYAFYNCTALTSITIGTDIDCVCTLGDTNQFNANTVIYVPSSLLSSYQSATNWSTFASQMVGV